MKDENAFNRHLGKELTKLHKKRVFHMKAADKFRSGVSDFLIWRVGSSLAIESKFVKDLGDAPKLSKKKLLSHAFSGEQITFLESIALSGNHAWGLVAIDEIRRMVMVPYREIPENGNWKTSEFVNLMETHFVSFNYEDVEMMLRKVM